MSAKERIPPDKELTQLASIMGQQFISRWDQYPKQLDDGRYVTVHKPLDEELLIAHLKGEMTLGTYLLDADSKGRFLVLDADDEPDWRRLKALARVLDEMGTRTYLERSRRGGHWWAFFKQRLSGEDLRTFGQGLMAHFSIEDIEMFPKQERLSSGPGSLIRLPFGVHLQTGRRYGFFRPDGEPLAGSLREQMVVLSQPEIVSSEVFKRFFDHGKQLNELDSDRETVSWDTSADRKTVEGEQLSDRIKAATPVRQFVLQYVELTKSGRGLCPFHDDHVESFSVNDQENYWNCFAGCGGGSVIDFYMKWKECDFSDAVVELAELLL